MSKNTRHIFAVCFISGLSIKHTYFWSDSWVKTEKLCASLNAYDIVMTTNDDDEIGTMNQCLSHPCTVGQQVG